MKKLIITLVCLLFIVTMAGCGNQDDIINSQAEKMQNLYGENKEITEDCDMSLGAVCSNGIFVGCENEGVISYKGIPYAKSPTGSLRWKPAEEPDSSDKVYEAYYYGKSPIQTEWPSEVGSYYEQGEDCLTLNVWTNTEVQENKTVMVFFHGGSYGWGGTSDPMYDGENFVKAHPDIVLVTVEYRTGIMGFVDFSEVPGGEEYSESGNLGLLDMVCSLKWVQKNIEAFGGNPENVTIMGESAGGGAVSLLPLIDGTEGLFNRVIAESGSIALTYSREECENLTEMLLEETGAENMTDLMNLSEDELMEVNEKLNDYNNFPERDGIVLPENLYKAYEDGAASDIDLLIGTNADETRYWISEMGYYTPLVSGDIIYKLGMPIMYESDTKGFALEDENYLEQFMNLQHEKTIWNITEFYNEILFRVPALYQAQTNAQNGGTTYVYYFNYPSAIGEVGACHAVELAYVFNNLDETIYTGDNIDKNLAATVQNMWVNFAKTGNPSTEEISWPQYTDDNKLTMILDSECHTEVNWLSEQADLITPLLKYGLNGCYTRLDFNVPCVYKYAATVASALAVAITLLVLLCRAFIRRKRPDGWKMKINNYFKTEKVNTGRQDELDIVKGLAIIFMVWCHVYEELGADTSTISGMLVDSILGGPFAAPMFMICMGIGVCYSRNQEPKQFLIRGLRLLALGYALNLFRYVIPQAVVCIIEGKTISWNYMLCRLMEVDILQFAGLAFLGIGLSKKLSLPNKVLLGIAAVMSVAGVLLKDTGTGLLLPDLLLGLFWKTQSHAYFTLFHWFVFPVVGMFFGEWLQRCTDKIAVYKRLIPICIPIGLAAEGGAILLGISLLDSFTEYFYLTLIDAVFLIALFVVWAGILCLLHKRFPGVKIGLLRRMSRDINSIYCIHWLILGGVCAVKAVTIPVYTPGFVIAAGFAAIILVISVWIAGKVRWKV